MVNSVGFSNLFYFFLELNCGNSVWIALKCNKILARSATYTAALTGSTAFKARVSVNGDATSRT